MAVYDVSRDGRRLAQFETETAAWQYLHRLCPSSIEHATKHEGYAIVSFDPKGWAVEVHGVGDPDGVYTGNAIVFPSRESADAYGFDLLCRWFGADDYRIVRTELAPTMDSETVRRCVKATTKGAGCDS